MGLVDTRISRYWTSFIFLQHSIVMVIFISRDRYLLVKDVIIHRKTQTPEKAVRLIVEMASLNVWTRVWAKFPLGRGSQHIAVQVRVPLKTVLQK
ncbi:hypothetical protein HOLleu_33974 [Holothuria leucospilota]|uniref:Uncharacterized protein n=1 Tax=Holothuria leucospilota TaxID=206669 RepID=A0A9Q1BFW1_HOLLE|nr:hypothetical protein HOLleu_33974 [Holothuria leucospilota]